MKESSRPTTKSPPHTDGGGVGDGVGVGVGGLGSTAHKGIHLSVYQ